METLFIAGLSSFVAIITTACVQYFFSRKSSIELSNRNRKTEAYLEYLEAFCGSKFKVTDSILKQAVDAKLRICLYGDFCVVKELSKFVSSGENLINEEPVKNFVSLIFSMRKDLFRGAVDLTESDIEGILRLRHRS